MAAKSLSDFQSGGFLRDEMISDRDLLVQFVEQGAEAAFAAMVERHVNEVFSTALRRLGGDRRLAEDATQEVFVALARQAGAIRSGERLAGWLHRHTCFVTANLVRSEQRRKSRELTAAEMTNATDTDQWKSVAPMLDSMIDNLPAPDREAILLRFFSQDSLESIGCVLGVSEDAAQKRISRAVEKLGALFRKNGITLSSTALLSLLTTKSVAAAPLGLACAITVNALAGATITTVTAGTVLVGKIKAGAALALIGAAVIGPIGVQYRSNARLKRENVSLQAQLQKQESKPIGHGPEEAAPRTQSPATEATAEVLQLRGQIGVLRAELAAKTNTPRRMQVLSESEFEDFEPSLKPDEVRQILTFDSLHDAGSKTPEATMQTYLWTVGQTLNPDRFTNANERVKQLVYTRAGARYGGFAPDVKADPLLDSKFVKIEAITYETDNHAKIKVNGYNDVQGYQRGTVYSLVREGEEWKMDFGIGLPR